MFKWISLVLALIIVYLLRTHLLPRFNPAANHKEHKTLTYNEDLNRDLRWTESKALMPFVGSLDYAISRSFYSDIGFKVEDGNKHCKVFVNEYLSFWLQDYSNKQWLDNSMLFLDVPDIAQLKTKLKKLHLEQRYRNVKISETQSYDWGDEFFMHDPAGVLWHFCEFHEGK